MHFKLTNTIWAVLVFLLISFTNACKTNTQRFEDKLYTDHIIEVANAVEDTPEYQKAIYYIDSSVAGRSLSPNDKYRIYFLKGYIYQNKLLDFRKALLCADSMLWIVTRNKSENTGDQNFQAYKLIADANYSLEKYKAAYENYEIAKQIADTISSPYIRSRYLFSLGMANYKGGKYLDAARLFAQASERAANAQEPDAQYLAFYRQEALGNTGLAYTKSDRSDSALFYYRSAIDFINSVQHLYPERKKNWDEALSIVCGNLADLYKQSGNRDSAEYYFVKSITISKLSGRNASDREYNMLKLADIYINDKAYEKANTLINEVSMSAQEDSSRKSSADSLELVYRQTAILSKYYERTGNYALAFDYLQKHHQAQEQKWDNMQKRIVNNLEEGISNVGHEKQIMLLESDKKIRNQRIAILVLLCLVSVSGLLLIYYRMSLHKTNSKVLKTRNQEILFESSSKHEELQRQIDTDRANYLSLLENTEDCLWSLDKDLNILAFNKAYKDFIFEVSGEFPKVGEKDKLEEIDSKFYSKILSGYQTALSGAIFNSVDKGIKTGDRNLDFAMRFNPVKDDNGVIIGITCFRKDITEYFILIDSLKKNTEQFKNIAWIQSHALRGPLTTVMGIAHLLSEEEDDADKANNKELIKGMKEKLDEMDKIVKEIVKLTY